MKISKRKFELICARKLLGITEVAREMNTSVQSLNKIINRGTCQPIYAGRIAKAIGLDVTEIIDD